MFNKQTQQLYDSYLAEQKNGNEFDPEDDEATMEKRWAFLAKFEQNFNHVYKAGSSTFWNRNQTLYPFIRFIWIQCNSLQVARTLPCLL